MIKKIWKKVTGQTRREQEAAEYAERVARNERRSRANITAAQAGKRLPYPECYGILGNPNLLSYDELQAAVKARAVLRGVIERNGLFALKKAWGV